MNLEQDLKHEADHLAGRADGLRLEQTLSHILSTYTAPLQFDLFYSALL